MDIPCFVCTDTKYKPGAKSPTAMFDLSSVSSNDFIVEPVIVRIETVPKCDDTSVTNCLLGLG